MKPAIPIILNGAKKKLKVDLTNLIQLSNEDEAKKNLYAINDMYEHFMARLLKN